MGRRARGARGRVAWFRGLWDESAVKLACLLLGLACTASPAGGQCQYEVTQLDYPINCALGPVITNASGLNNHGVVVGSYQCALWTHTEAYQWTAEGGYVTLPRPPAVCSSAASDISDNGVIVGTYGGVCCLFRGFVYEDGQYTELPPLQARTIGPIRLTTQAWSSAGCSTSCPRTTGTG